jgi:hypothetical protein
MSCAANPFLSPPLLHGRILAPLGIQQREQVPFSPSAQELPGCPSPSVAHLHCSFRRSVVGRDPSPRHPSSPLLLWRSTPLGPAGACLLPWPPTILLCSPGVLDAWCFNLDGSPPLCSSDARDMRPTSIPSVAPFASINAETPATPAVVVVGLCSFPKLASSPRSSLSSPCPTSPVSAHLRACRNVRARTCKFLTVPPRTPPCWMWTALPSLYSSSVAVPRAPPLRAAMVGSVSSNSATTCSSSARAVASSICAAPTSLRLASPGLRSPYLPSSKLMVRPRCPTFLVFDKITKLLNRVINCTVLAAPCHRHASRISCSTKAPSRGQHAGMRDLSRSGCLMCAICSLSNYVLVDVGYIGV